MSFAAGWEWGKSAIELARNAPAAVYGFGRTGLSVLGTGFRSLGSSIYRDIITPTGRWLYGTAESLGQWVSDTPLARGLNWMADSTAGFLVDATRFTVGAGRAIGRGISFGAGFVAGAAHEFQAPVRRGGARVWSGLTTYFAVHEGSDPAQGYQQSHAKPLGFTGSGEPIYSGGG